MYDSRTPPDVVSSTGGCRGSRPEVDSTSTFRSPTQKIRDDRSPVYTLPTSLSSSSPVLASLPLTSSTPERATNETVSRHVDVLLDEPASSPSCLDVTDDGGCVHRPTDHDVGQTPTHWKRRRRPTKSMIVISEDDVDDLFQPVNINGDSFALLQTPIRSFASPNITFYCNILLLVRLEGHYMRWLPTSVRRSSTARRRSYGHDYVI